MLSALGEHADAMPIHAPGFALGSSISRIDDNLTAWTPEKYFQRIQNVSPQDTLITYEIRVLSAGVQNLLLA